MNKPSTSTSNVAQAASVAPAPLIPTTIEETTLTADQERKWADTMALMQWNAPGFRHLFFKMLYNNNGNYGAVPTPSVPVAATDGKNMLINPKRYFEYGLQERVFIAGHEVLHNVYSDVEFLHRCTQTGTVPMRDGTTKPFRNSTMQKAMDYRINALLVESRIGVLPKDALYDLKIAGPNDSVTDVYGKIYKKDDPDDHKGLFDLVLAPGASTGQHPNTAANQRNNQVWAVELAAAQHLESLKSQGSMPGGMSRMFKDLLEPQVPWTDKIRGIFSRKVGSGGSDWKRPDRRFITRDLYMPSRSGFGAGWVTVWGDTSGSIGSNELNKYLGELGSILDDVRPKRLTVLWCDSKIHHIDELKEASDLQEVKRRGVGGGGGTDVKPVLDWIAKNGNGETPECFIGFTDGYVSFPKHPPEYLTIWASVSDQKYPYGDVVRIT